MVSILSKEENEFVVGFVISRHGSNQEIWIGYNDLDVEGTYTWLDGSPGGYDSWRPGFPVGDAYGNQDCILTYQKLWKEYPCGNSQGAVCKMPRFVLIL